MKKQFLTFSILITLFVALSGCSNFEAEKEPREPLDISRWPTPAAPTDTPPPTPFPIVTLPPTVAPTPPPPPKTGDQKPPQTRSATNPRARPKTPRPPGRGPPGGGVMRVRSQTPGHR